MFGHPPTFHRPLLRHLHKLFVMTEVSTVHTEMFVIRLWHYGIIIEKNSVPISVGKHCSVPFIHEYNSIKLCRMCC